MSLQIGQQLGSYQITSLIGKGGMGEVYRAKDTKLKRDVAIKILPDEFSRDTDRVSRFQREAESLAALNHQNIAGIYDLQQSDATRFLVLELVEGDTLADILKKRGALPVDESLGITRQICEALEAAHEKGIIHRDLKPGNVKITPEGKLKVLDFGLAKRDVAEADARAASQSPTMTIGGTRDGIILGTAAYMSPEQARGQAVDKRTDIWAFGCVLYEMLTGRVAFAGATISDTIAAILEREPDWTILPKAAPSSVRALLRRCLTKDSKRRLRDIGDAGIELSLVAEEPSQSRRPRRGVAVVALATLALALGIGVGRLVVPRGETSRTDPQLRLALTPATANEGVTSDPAVSKDGTLLAYASDRAGSNNLDIWIQQAAGSAVATDP